MTSFKGIKIWVEMFNRWLSAEFMLWVNVIVNALISSRTGTTTMQLQVLECTTSSGCGG